MHARIDLRLTLSDATPISMTPLRRGSPLLTLLLGALSAVPPMCIDMNLPALPAIEQTYDVAQRGALTLSLFLVGFAISPLFAGAWADRYGRRPVLLTGLLLMSLSAAAAAYAPDFTTLLAARLVQGLGAGACAALPIAMVRDLYEGNDARIKFAQLTAVLGIAPVVAPLLGGVVFKLFGWHAILLAQAVIGVLLMIAAAAALPETLHPDYRRKLNARALFQGYRQVWLTPRYRAYTLTYVFAFACMFTYISGAATVLMGELGLEAGLFSLVFAISSAGVVVGSTVSGMLVQRGVPTRTLMRSGLTAMVGLSALALAGVLAGMASVWLVAAAAALVIFGFALAAPYTTHESMEPVPQLAGAASGLQRSLQMAVGSAASALVTAAMAGTEPAVAMTALMLVFASGAGWMLRHGERASRPGAASVGAAG